LTAEDVADLGIGTIVGWDADGLMTNVRWQVMSLPFPVWLRNIADFVPAKGRILHVLGVN